MIEEFLNGHPSLANDGAQRPDRKALPIWDDHQSRRAALQEHCPMAALASAWSLFETGLPERRDDLPRRK
jgi:hypothetical protein